MKKMIILLATVVIIFVSYCKNSNGEHKADNNIIRVFFTGETLGELEPCGCSGEKLGGVLQRSGCISELQQQKSPLLLVDGGLADPDKDRQAQIKLDIYHSVLQKLNYIYCFANHQEAKQIKNPSPWYLLHTVENYKLLFVSIEKSQAIPEPIDTILEKTQPHAVFVVTKGFALEIPEDIGNKNYHWFVLVADAQEPLTAKQHSDNVMVITPGNKGRYASLLTLNFDKTQLSEWKAENIGMSKKFQAQKNIAQELEKYKSQVREEQLLDQLIKPSSSVGFVGSEMCQDCHSYEYQQWSDKRHAKAFHTLEKQNYQYDPECVGCHVVGFQYAEGFFNPEESDYLVHVGCESCHGAGAQHVTTLNKDYGKTEGAKTCLPCHHKDHSPKFKYEEYFKKIKHWKDK